MFSHNFYVFTYVCLFLYITQSCISEPLYPPQLVLYSAGEPEYTDVVVKRVGDNLTLVCELRDDLTSLTGYVWNYIPDNDTAVRPYTVTPSSGPSSSSTLYKADLRVSDSGQYLCSAPPFSVTKYILVQTRGPLQCARGAFWCGARCVLPGYVCDGFVDCLHGEDESPQLCDAQVCSRSDKLNCSSGRCISAAACCRRAAPLCRQPACCEEYPRHASLEGYLDVEFPKAFDDRHAPDDYGFIQSTIYTVTACALIFMLAVVLLVSAICKMHMKRAALRQYTQPELYHRHQPPRFPPCYEASRLLESSPPPPPPLAPEPPPPPPPRPRGLARLTSIFNNRYRQVPTNPPEVEMTSYRAPSLQSSPSRDYRSPTYTPSLQTDFRFLDPETETIARDLNHLDLTYMDNPDNYLVTPDSPNFLSENPRNLYMATPPDSQRNFSYMATPIEFFRRRAMRRNTLERVFDQIDQQRMTLQLGRFQLSLPRFGRTDDRPDTPNVAEININDLDFVRLNSNETYTLNGRTIRLFGGNFENYPPVLGGNGGNCPPSYNDAVRYKFFGPPPEYLSREGLNVTRTDDEARSNVEMPPCYDDLASGGTGNAGTLADGTGNVAGNGTGIIDGSNSGILEDNACSVARDSTGNAGSLADSTGTVAGNGTGGNNAGIIAGSNAGILADGAGTVGSNIRDLAGTNSIASGGTGNSGSLADGTGTGGFNTGIIAGSNAGILADNIASGGTGNLADGTGIACSGTGTLANFRTIISDATSLNNGITASNSNTGINTSDVDTASALNNGNISRKITGISNVSSFNTGINNGNTVTPNDSNGNIDDLNTGNEPVETLRSIIDNLPAIDSDVNANDTGIEADINTVRC